MSLLLRLVALLVVATACSPGGPTADPPNATTPSAPSPENPTSSSADTVATVRVPDSLATLARADGELPADLPARAGNWPSVLADPPGRAVLVYRPPEAPAGSDGADGSGDIGWSSEQLWVYGQDRHWRLLDLGGLGLPESSWPQQGVYGTGALSFDGRWWAGHSEAGVVFVDLRSGTVKTVPVPEIFPLNLAVRWVPGRLVVRALSMRAGKLISPTGSIRRSPGLPLPGPLNADGSVVETERVDSHTVTLRGLAGGPTEWSLDIPVGWELDGPYATVLGPDAVAIGLVHVGGSDVSESVVVAFDRHSGSVLGRLRAKGHIRPLGWQGDRVVVRVGDRGVLGWSPTTASLQRLLLLPAPGPGRASPAVLGVGLPGL